MKKSKKLLSLLLAVIMVFTMAAPAMSVISFAADSVPSPRVAAEARVSITPVTYVCNGSDTHANGNNIQAGTVITFSSDTLSLVGEPVPTSGNITLTRSSNGNEVYFAVSGTCAAGTNLGFKVSYTDGTNTYNQMVYTYVRSPQRNAHGISAFYDSWAWSWCDNQTIYYMLNSEGTGGNGYLTRGYSFITGATDVSGSQGSGKEAVNSPVPLATYYIDKSIHNNISEVVKVKASLGRNTKDDNATSQIKIAAFGSRSIDTTAYNGYSSPETGVYNLGRTVDSSSDNLVRSISGPVQDTSFTVQMDTFEPSKHNSGTNYVQIDVIIKAVDKGALRTLINNIYNNYPQEIFYTTSSYNNFKGALATATKVLNNPTEIQLDIDTAYKKLDTAYKALVPKLADYAAVNAAIAKVPADLSVYTDDSAAAVTNAVNSVVRDKPIWEQADVDAMAEAIEDAIAKLTYKGADYSEVDKAVERYDALVRGNYTEDTLQAADDAVNAVDRTLNISQQADVDAMAKAINDAIDALVLRGADYSRIDELIAYTNTLIKTNYTNYFTVLRALQAVKRGYDISRQAEVDAMANNIQTAIDGLILKAASYREVDTAITNYKALDSSLYTPESYAAVTDAVNAVKRGLDITHQKEVDAMATAINDAIANLQLLQPVDIVSADGSTTVIDKERKYIYGLDESINSLEGYAYATNGGSLRYSGVLGTGAIVELIDKDGTTVIDTYTIIIFGDLDGDAAITPNDTVWAETVASRLYAFPEDYFAFAMDVDGSGDGTPNDVIYIEIAASRILPLNQGEIARLVSAQ